MQWVEDCFAVSYAGLPTDGSAYKVDVTFSGINGELSFVDGTNSCSYGGLGGGDWGDTPRMIRSDRFPRCYGPGVIPFLCYEMADFETSVVLFVSR